MRRREERLTYGGRTVSAATMDHARARNLYAVLLDANGNVIAHSTGFNAQARADLRESGALSLIRAGHVYALGNLVSYGKTGAIDFAIALQTPNGMQRC
jgi:hypothetical protein